MKFYISGTSDAGIKKAINQDSILVQRIDTLIGQTVFACVCDGMGGLQYGELSSATVLYRFKKWVSECLPSLTKDRAINSTLLFQQWSNVVNECNEKIRLYCQKRGITSGTTLSAILLTQNEFFIVNVGDSRTYEISTEIRQLTKDHTYVQQEVDCGRMTADEALKSNKRHILTRCIGVNPTVNPDFYTGKVNSNAIYMLCSDGFRHMVSEQELLSGFNADKISSSEELKNIESFFVQLNKERFETDNISVVSILTK